MLPGSSCAPWLVASDALSPLTSYQSLLSSHLLPPYACGRHPITGKCLRLRSLHARHNEAKVSAQADAPRRREIVSYLCPVSTAALFLVQSFNSFLLWPLF